MAKKAKNVKAKKPKRPWIPLGIGSHHAIVESNVIFGDYEFTRTDVGNYKITFFGVKCRKKEPPPVIFTSAGGSRHAAVEGWGCKKGDLTIWVTCEEDGQMADFDFDWVVYRG